MSLSPILLVSGTRPEVIKLAPLYRALMASHWAKPVWLHTGQHGDMAEQMMDCFDIEADIRLVRQGETLSEFSAGCRTQLDAVMTAQNWSCVIVQGDTESAFLGALAGYYARIPVGHVEAGLRTYNLSRPFPEEGLRQMIGRIATHHFAPTRRAMEALVSEGVSPESIYLTGNTVVDAQLWAQAAHGIGRKSAGQGHLLVTMHRRENWGPDLEGVCCALGKLARSRPHLQVLFPVHLNPVVREPVHRLLGHCPNVQLVPPLDYLQMQQALVNACVVLTDSGGIQEEAPTYGVPLLVLREETERPEVIEAGCGVLVGTDPEEVTRWTQVLLDDELQRRRMQLSDNPFGKGDAGQQIADILMSRLSVADVVRTGTIP